MPKYDVDRQAKDMTGLRITEIASSGCSGGDHLYASCQIRGFVGWENPTHLLLDFLQMEKEWAYGTMEKQ